MSVWSFCWVFAYLDYFLQAPLRHMHLEVNNCINKQVSFFQKKPQQSIFSLLWFWLGVSAVLGWCPCMAIPLCTNTPPGTNPQFAITWHWSRLEMLHYYCRMATHFTSWPNTGQVHTGGNAGTPSARKLGAGSSEGVGWSIHVHYDCRVLHWGGDHSVETYKSYSPMASQRIGIGISIDG